jgi:iron complex transport system permease protein
VSHRLRQHVVLAGLILTAALGALWIGPELISPLAAWEDASVRREILEASAPRACAALAVGAALGAAGALLQALLRNPLADPALLGLSGGAALGGAGVLTLAGGAELARGIALPVPLAAFAGTAVCMLLLWRFGRVRGVVRLSAVVLAGVGVNALVGALIGLLMAFSDDQALRDTTFWLFGTLTRADWPSLLPLAIAVPLAILVAEVRATALDQYQLGDREARQIGLGVGSLRWLGLGLACLLTALAVAVAGIVGFVGLIVPYLARTLSGPEHGGRILDSALFGALLLLLADVGARTLVAPAEIPIGLITALLGAPFFLLALRRELGREP